mgnify:CR=1 FL=1
MEYVEAPDVKRRMEEIVDSLGFSYVASQFVYCYRSKGSKSKRIIARIHGLTKLWQEALGQPPTYIVEVISERYDRLSEKEKEKTIIHELLHVPKGFSGGFRPHRGYIDRKQIENLYKMLLEKRALKTT